VLNVAHAVACCEVNNLASRFQPGVHPPSASRWAPASASIQSAHFSGRHLKQTPYVASRRRNHRTLRTDSRLAKRLLDEWSGNQIDQEAFTVANGAACRSDGGIVATYASWSASGIAAVMSGLSVHVRSGNRSPLPHRPLLHGFAGISHRSHRVHHLARAATTGAGSAFPSPIR
jgi:hypothetical protein